VDLAENQITPRSPQIQTKIGSTRRIKETCFSRVGLLRLTLPARAEAIGIEQNPRESPSLKRSGFIEYRAASLHRMQHTVRQLRLSNLPCPQRPNGKTPGYLSTRQTHHPPVALSPLSDISNGSGIGTIKPALLNQLKNYFN
jgi:hypothetical protein